MHHDGGSSLGDVDVGAFRGEIEPICPNNEHVAGPYKASSSLRSTVLVDLVGSLVGLELQAISTPELAVQICGLLLRSMSQSIALSGTG